MLEKASDYSEWVGVNRTCNERIEALPAKRLAALLDIDDQPDIRNGDVPAFWHWVYFCPLAAAREIGPDGHPRRGDFLPPVALPRRVFGGSECEFLAPLHIGKDAVLSEMIVDVASKSGRTGPLVIVKVERSIVQEEALRIRETQTIVYRDASGGAGAPSEPADRTAQWETPCRPSPVDLFRFSAVTFNAHRIHYDRDYAREQEGYPGLVVHGPYTAIRLLEEARARLPGKRLARFDFRPRSLIFDLDGFKACGRIDGNEAELWASVSDGGVAMTASAIFTD